MVKTTTCTVKQRKKVIFTWEIQEEAASHDCVSGVTDS